MADPDFVSWTDEQIRDFVLTTAERESGFDRSESVGPITGLWEMDALALQRGWDVGVRPVARNIDPTRATGFYLRVHGIGAGASLRPARAARGYATATSATGGRVREGAIFVADDQQFAVDTTTRLAAGQATAVPITAQATGPDGNVPAGTPVTTPSPDPADVAVRLDAQWITAHGHAADEVDTPEGTELYRRRVLLGYNIRGDAHLVDRYRLAAFGVDGVSSCAVGRAPRGPGTVAVVVLFLGRLPTDDQLDLVRAALDDAGLGGDDVRVVAPSIVSVVVTATIVGTANTADVEEAIEAWWRANVGIGDGVSEAALHAGATAGLEGVESINYSSPSADLPKLATRWYSPAITVTRA